MRIAFVSANQEKLPDPVIPLGLLSVMASTPAHHEVELWDLCFETDPEAVLRDRLTRWQPDVVAMGLRNLQNSLYTGIHDNLAYYQRLIAQVRTCPALLVLGGSGFSVMPRELMELLGADFGVQGEGELAFAALLTALESGGVETVSGLFRATEAGVVCNPVTEGFLDLSLLPRPSRHRVDPRYYEVSATDSVQTKRGCPLRCQYCTYPIIEGRKSRRRSPAEVVDELETVRLEHPNVEHVFLVDSVFTLPARHAKAVCQEMINRRWALPWTCYANPIGFDEELARLMVQAGCAGLEIGTDSGSDAVLVQQQKGFLCADIERMSRLCAQVGLKDCHTFVLGLDGETEDTVRQSLDFLDRLDPFAAILMLYMDEQEGIDEDRAARRRALRERTGQLVTEACKDHPRWTAPQLGIRFGERLFRVLRKMGMRGPLWQQLDR